MDVKQIEHFFSLNTRLNRAILQFKTKFSNLYELKPFHTSMIYNIGRADNQITQKDLILKTQEDKGNISRGLHLLEDRGIIIPRHNNGVSTYRNLVSLSGYGMEIYTNLVNSLRSIFEDQILLSYDSNNVNSFLERLAFIINDTRYE